MREKWPYYRRKLYFLLLAISFGLGVHGMYVYYRPIIERDWQLVSAMLYGTMKLYLFSPPLGVTDNVTISYEIAKWLAPILTSALVLTALTNRILHLKNWLANRFGNHIAVFGASPASLAFFQNLKHSRPRFGKTLITQTALSDDDKQAYEKLAVAVTHQDPRQLSQPELEPFIRHHRLQKSQHLLFLDEDEATNYQLFMSLLSELDPSQPVKVHLQLTSKVLMRYVEQAVERRRSQDSRYDQLDLHFFNLAGLTVEKLLGRGQSVRFVQPQLDKLAPQTNFLEALEPVHLFVLGNNDYSEELIMRSVNDFVIGRDKIKVSLVDRNANASLDDFWYHHPMLEEALDLEAFDSLPGKRSFAELAQAQPYTAVFLNHEDPLVNLQALSYFPADLPVAFRNQPKIDLRELETTHPNILFYGDLDQIMTRSIVLQEELDQAAQAFNQDYGQVAEILGSGGSGWDKLSPTKKASSRLSAAHGFMKQALLRAYFDQPDQVITNELAADQTRFQQLVDSRQGEDFRQGLLALFRDRPYLEYLSELEHRRWSYSYYAMGYRQGSVKDEVNKTHPCLNCSWDWLMEEAFFQCHPEYDLISVLSLFGDANEKTQ